MSVRRSSTIDLGYLEEVELAYLFVTGVVCSVEVMVCHMRGKARAGEPVVGSIASRSLMAEIKLLICKIGSRD